MKNDEAIIQEIQKLAAQIPTVEQIRTVVREEVRDEVASQLDAKLRPAIREEVRDEVRSQLAPVIERLDRIEERVNSLHALVHDDPGLAFQEIR